MTKIVSAMAALLPWHRVFTIESAERSRFWVDGRAKNTRRKHSIPDEQDPANTVIQTKGICSICSPACLSAKISDFSNNHRSKQNHRFRQKSQVLAKSRISVKSQILAKSRISVKSQILAKSQIPAVIRDYMLVKGMSRAALPSLSAPTGVEISPLISTVEGVMTKI